ncbi:MAG: LPS export ABC transporter permease LptG [Gemmobacter sp.]|jgi:lipopolysaccharide export system permease protein
MTLALYFARRFAIVAGSVIAGLGALVVLFETIEHLRIYSASGIGLRGALALAALAMPMQLYALLPLATMLGAVALFVALARSSELIATRAAGRSALRALAGPAAAALVLGLVATSIANPLAVASAEAHDRRIDALLGRAPAEVGSIGREGLWLRQATETGQMVIRAGGVNADGSILSATMFLELGPDGLPLRRIDAARAELGPGFWSLAEVKLWRFDSDNPERDAQSFATGTIPTDLTAARIRDSLGRAEDVSVWDLRAAIAALERAGFSSTAFRMQLQSHLVLPAMLAAMVLVAAAFTLGHGRGGGTGLRVLAAVIAGFATFILADFASALGASGRIPVTIAAWMPPVVAALGALTLLLHLEDG